MPNRVEPDPERIVMTTAAFVLRRPLLKDATAQTRLEVPPHELPQTVTPLLRLLQKAARMAPPVYLQPRSSHPLF